MKQNWFLKRNLRLLKYQEDVIHKLESSLSKEEITILAACPSAGKTIISIYMLDDYLINNPTHRVLILAHGTTILRSQYHDELIKMKPDFTYNLVESFNQYDNTKQVNVCLPQSLVNNSLPKIDLLIVDEAHQFYYAKKMVVEIIKKTQPRKQLLLTGTPSPFILRNMPIIPITLNTIFDEGMVSDLFVEIATSSYNFDIISDMNRYNELVNSYQFNKENTNNTLDDLLNEIIKKLKSIKTNYYINISNWLPTLKSLKKTMFACKNQQQAKQVKDYFYNIGINSALSISDTDNDSEEIIRFINDKDCLILIVVGRAILGFNLPILSNIVDMTLSTNIDRIYQLMSRVIRKHPDADKKLFIKISSSDKTNYYKYIMNCVLMMSDESFYTKFNGKNLDNLQIPVINKPKRSNNNIIKSGSKSPIEFGNIPVLSLFKSILHSTDALLHTYAYTTIKDVRSEYMNRKASNYWNEKRCATEALKYKSKSDFIKYSGSAYDSASKKGLIDKICAHMIEGNNSRGFWRIKSNCEVEALKFTTRKEFQINSSSAYDAARKKKWLDDICSHMTNIKKPKGYWTKERCKKESLKYKTRSEFNEKSSSAYMTSLRKKWLDEFFPKKK